MGDVIKNHGQERQSRVRTALIAAVLLAAALGLAGCVGGHVQPAKPPTSSEMLGRYVNHQTGGEITLRQNGVIDFAKVPKGVMFAEQTKDQGKAVSSSRLSAEGVWQSPQDLSSIVIYWKVPQSSTLWRMWVYGSTPSSRQLGLAYGAGNDYMMYFEKTK